ncbi:hypothetical protein [Candidatus Liberibacter americanus]|uniref:Uncharacterized protein n=1 Tax=Candidatus Liberibacter americanus str. Sao Paulo TaxID=1261131 RepID=U6B7V5_9HYPH|nr:hypothetical protein [Candidatus Liberibacter americanus]AHA27807.1 hypothetical protein lam_445 [Candidatus Liberibacter americanus str. Sao Paulo]EMS36190.1 hypothetical protein G653_03056 [Candidatus Liberibacter americanus PW_SP]
MFDFILRKIEFSFHSISENLPTIGFLSFILIYALVYSLIIATWKYRVNKHPKLDLLASMICGLLMSVLIFLSFIIIQNKSVNRKTPYLPTNISTHK